MLSGSLALHTINWFSIHKLQRLNTHKLQRLNVQRPLLIEAGSAYISHGDLLHTEQVSVILLNHTSMDWAADCVANK